MPRKGVIPPQFLKHPPKSWKKDMPRVRAEAREDRKKARTDYRGTRMSKREKRRKSVKRDIHVVPDVLMTLGAIEPALNSGIDWHYYPDKGLAGNLGYYADGIVGGYTNVDNLKTVAILELLGIGAKWLGKKTGLNRVGSKDVRVL